MTIYFIRHGQTDWNIEGRLQGQTDIPINTIGKEQAERNGSVLAELIPDPENWNFISSPLGRTRHTMEIIRTFLNVEPLDYQTDDRLMEVHFGNWQGKTWNEIEVDYPDHAQARILDRWNNKSPGQHGESYAMLHDRIMSWLYTVDTKTVCVSHGGVNRCLQKHVRNLQDNEASHLKVPHDKIMMISNGMIEWI